MHNNSFEGERDWALKTSEFRSVRIVKVDISEEGEGSHWLVLPGTTLPYWRNSMQGVSLFYSCCRSVLKKAAIAYRQNLVLFLEFRWYAIAVFFKNASTSRVP